MSQANDKGRMARELPSLSAGPENLMTKLPDAWLWKRVTLRVSKRSTATSK